MSILYNNGKKNIDIKIINNKLYYGSVLAEGFHEQDNKLFKDGILYNGDYNPETRMYRNGVILLDGMVNCIYYKDGVPFTGTAGTNIFINGISEDPFLYEGVWYKDGALFTGVIGINHYVNGVSSEGYVIFEDQLFYDSVLYTDDIIYEEMYFTGGSKGTGLYEDCWYRDGDLIRDSHTQVMVNTDDVPLLPSEVDETDTTLRMFVGSEEIEDYIIANDSDIYDILSVHNWVQSTHAPLVKKVYTGKVTNPIELFNESHNLTSLVPFSSWDTSSFTSLTKTFRYTDITSLEGLEYWDVSNVTLMEQPFENCTLLNDITQLKKWNVSKCTDLDSVFRNCTILTSLEGLEDWDVSNVTRMDDLFELCISIESLLPLSNWNTSKCEDMYDTFSDCASLTSLEGLEDWDVSKCTDFSCTFQKTRVSDLTPISNWDVSAGIDFYKTFYQCPNISDLSLISDWDTSNGEDYRYMFEGCTSLTTLNDITHWRLSGNISDMFNLCTGLDDGLYKFKGRNDIILYVVFVENSTIVPYNGLCDDVWIRDSWFFQNGRIQILVDSDDVPFVGNQQMYDDRVATGEVFRMFVGDREIQDFVIASNDTIKDLVSGVSDSDSLILDDDLESIYVGMVNDFTGLFENYSIITQLCYGMSTWNTSNVYSIEGMFRNCTSLINIEAMSQWDLSHVRNNISAFEDCELLDDISPLVDLSSGASEIVADSMFRGCSFIQDVSPLSSFLGINSMIDMFRSCSNLTNVTPFESWDISYCENFAGAFADTGVTDIDIDNLIVGWKSNPYYYGYHDDTVLSTEILKTSPVPVVPST